MTQYTKEEILKKISTTSWFLTWEILPGIYTQGLFKKDIRFLFDTRMHLPKDLSNKQILEIGTWDGAVAFELEKRGAHVTAVDIQNPENTGFNVAKDILESNIKYIQANVYDLDKYFLNQFDMVIFFGVYYHLKSPIPAFEQINKVLKQKGILWFDGECLINYAETLEGQPAKGLDISTLANSDVPMSLCYPRKYKNQENWFIPNQACLNSWLTATGFSKMENIYITDDAKSSPPSQRILAMTTKSHETQDEHVIYPKNWRQTN